jgi:hypothetical protein
MTMMSTTLNHDGCTSYESGSSISTISSSSNGSIPNEQVATLPFLHDEPQPQQITLQTAKAIVSSADNIEQALKESGRSYDRNLPMEMAMASHMASREISAREQAEKRGYMYDSYQKDVDRKNSKQQHEDTIACIKEEPAWMAQLLNARERGLGAISRAIIRGIALVALTKLAPFLYLVLTEGASFTLVAGEIIGTVSLE